MRHPDDEHLAHLLRSVRRQSGLTQVETARAAGVPVQDVIDIEGGRLGRVRVDRARQIFGGVDARLKVTAWWHGARADRLLDEAHAAIVEKVATVFSQRGWRVVPEWSFAEYGQRGSIDLFSAHVARRAVAVCEVKSAFGSLEETNRTLDMKVRLAPKLAKDAFGFEPAVVGRILILPDSAAARGVVLRHATTMDAIYPERSRAVRRWIRQPDRSIAAIWFLSNLGNSQLGTR